MGGLAHKGPRCKCFRLWESRKVSVAGSSPWTFLQPFINAKNHFSSWGAQKHTLGRIGGTGGNWPASAPQGAQVRDGGRANPPVVVIHLKINE